MNLSEIYHALIEGIKNVSFFEAIAVFTGILSVWFSRRESVLTYPVGLLNTIIYTWLSFKAHLPGEASVNFYYTVMSVFGWYNWTRRDRNHQVIVHITYSSSRDWMNQLLFFLSFYVAIFVTESLLKSKFYEVIPWADAFAAATAYTGMWLMTKKKVESWYWWIATNIASIPLYFVKELVVTSLYYLILLVFAFWGLAEWRKRARQYQKALS